MIYQSKHYVQLLFLCLLVSSVSMNAMQEEGDVTEKKAGFLKRWFGESAPKAVMATQLVTAGAAIAVVEYCKESPTLANIGTSINLTPNEMRTAAGVTGGLLAFSLIGNKNVADGATSLWWRIPAYTFLIAGIYSKTFESIIGKIPLGIGTALAENNKVAKGLLVIGFGVLLYKGLNKIEDKARDYLIGAAEKKQEEEEEA